MGITGYGLPDLELADLLELERYQKEVLA